MKPQLNKILQISKKILCWLLAAVLLTGQNSAFVHAGNPSAEAYATSDLITLIDDQTPFTVDGIHYLQSSFGSGLELTVIGFEKSFVEANNGNVTIPSSVTYENNEYSVTRFRPQHDLCPNGADAAREAAHMITHLTISEGVISVADVHRCVALADIKLPNSLRRIDLCAFQMLPLTNVWIPDNVYDLNTVFQGCTELKELNVPDTVFLNKSFQTLNPNTSIWPPRH